MALPPISFLWDLGKRTANSLFNYPIVILGWNATNQKLYPLSVDDSGNLSMSTALTVDPSGLASSANQATEIASLATIAASATAPTQFRSASQGATKAAIKGSAGSLYGYNFINPNAYAVYVRLYDSLAAGVTVGSTVPHTTIAVPASGSLVLANQGVPQLGFATGITIAVTKLVADNDSTALDTAILAEVTYK